ncbi:MAG: phosphotransferase [Deltaproteobacteria bacterium]|nr:phosphotransferase [Deltaproteobacteria bacterium]
MKASFLADFHVHSNFSDGRHSIPEVIDLYGSHGFGAIAITDHIAEEGSIIGKASQWLNQVLTPATFPLYRAILQSETIRAWEQYQMIVIPGFELSKNSLSNHRSAHLLGLGVDDYISADGDVADLCKRIRAQGGLSIAAHPVLSGKFEKQTFHLWDRKEELKTLFDAWEVASGSILFEAVKNESLPKIASSDLHDRRQIRSYKTKLHCEKTREAILQSIKSQQLEVVFYDRTAA